VRLGKFSSEHSKNYDFVVKMMSERIHEMIVQRRKAMREGTVDDLVNLKFIRIDPFRRAIVNGGPIIDMGIDDEWG
jgi:hypothetical protein